MLMHAHPTIKWVFHVHGRRWSIAVRAEQAAEGGIEKSGNAFAALKDIEEIQTLLPHRLGLWGWEGNWVSEVRTMQMACALTCCTHCICPQVPFPLAGQGGGV